MNKIKFKLLVLIILFSNVIFAQNILICQCRTVNVSGGETFMVQVGQQVMMEIQVVQNQYN